MLTHQNVSSYFLFWSTIDPARQCSSSVSTFIVAKYYWTEITNPSHGMYDNWNFTGSEALKFRFLQ